MNATTRAPIVLVIAMVICAACAGSPPVSGQPPLASDGASSPPESLLPDGLWEAELTADDFAATGAPRDAAEPGVYRWTFDGTRAHIGFDDGGWGCDGDAEPVGDAVRLTWHVAFNCGGFDTFSWDVDPEGLHLTFVEGNGDPVSTRALLEARPFQPVEGDATLSWSDAWLTCEDQERGACLGTLESGTYATDAFVPGLTYTVPDEWQNISDLQGEVVLFPPGQQLDAPHSEYIAVFTSVYAENRNCTNESEATSPQPGVGRTPEAIAAEFQQRPGLSVTEPVQVTIGGLSGLVIDVRMAPEWTGTCFYYEEPIVQLIGGRSPSQFSHGVESGQLIRLYLLAYDGGTLAIEMTDYADGAHLDVFTDIAEQFEFDDR